jgi:hypothetical protein
MVPSIIFIWVPSIGVEVPEIIMEFSKNKPCKNLKFSYWIIVTNPLVFYFILGIFSFPFVIPWFVLMEVMIRSRSNWFRQFSLMNHFLKNAEFCIFYCYIFYCYIISIFLSSFQKISNLFVQCKVSLVRRDWFL